MKHINTDVPQDSVTYTSSFDTPRHRADIGRWATPDGSLFPPGVVPSNVDSLLWIPRVDGILDTTELR